MRAFFFVFSKWGLFWVKFVEVCIVGHDVFAEFVGPPVRGSFKKIIVSGAATSVDRKQGEVVPPFLGTFGVPGEFRGAGNESLRMTCEADAFVFFGPLADLLGNVLADVLGHGFRG